MARDRYFFCKYIHPVIILRIIIVKFFFNLHIWHVQMLYPKEKILKVFLPNLNACKRWKKKSIKQTFLYIFKVCSYFAYSHVKNSKLAPCMGSLTCMYTFSGLDGKLSPGSAILFISFLHKFGLIKFQNELFWLRNDAITSSNYMAAICSNKYPTDHY